jgi:anaerobic selenocysteine-containing dehydrogenase
VDVTVEKGKIIKTKGSTLNPVTQGFICPRGIGDPKRVYSKQRVLYPHIKSDRQDAEQFARVAWDNALSHVSQNLKKAIETYGNDSILLYDYPGNQGFLAWQFPRRLWFALGAATTDYSLCSSSGHAGIGLHYGLTYGVQPEELAKTQVRNYYQRGSTQKSDIRGCRHPDLASAGW